MKNRIATISVLFLCYTSYSQQNMQAVVNASGGYAAHDYYRFEWSVGELALVNQMTSSDNRTVLTNGFIQPYILYPGRNPDGQLFDADEIRIFPIPASTYLEVNFFTKQKGKLHLQFYDVLGKKIYSTDLTSNGVDLIQRIPVNHLPQGTYLLHINLVPEPGSMAKKGTYKFIKIQ